MRRGIMVATLVATLVATAMAFSWQVIASPVKELPHYSFIVSQTDEGLEFICRDNCAWQKLRYSCGELPCNCVVDEKGVRTAHKSDWPTEP